MAAKMAAARQRLAGDEEPGINLTSRKRKLAEQAPPAAQAEEPIPPLVPAAPEPPVVVNGQLNEAALHETIERRVKRSRRQDSNRPFNLATPRSTHHSSKMDQRHSAGGTHKSG
jgi:hypothetical protein